MDLTKCTFCDTCIIEGRIRREWRGHFDVLIGDMLYLPCSGGNDGNRALDDAGGVVDYEDWDIDD